MFEPLDLIALFRAGMAFMTALNLVLALVMFWRHWGIPAHKDTHFSHFSAATLLERASRHQVHLVTFHVLPAALRLTGCLMSSGGILMLL